ELGVLGVFGAGVLTVFTPCVLPLLPIYLSVLLGAPIGEAGGLTGKSRMKLVANAALFSAGFIVVFTLLGLSATALGALIVKNKVYFSLFGGLVIVLFGLKFIGWLKIGFLDKEARLDGSKLQAKMTPLGALLMGVIFAFGWTPCVGPILGAVLTYTANRTTQPLQGAAYLFVYGLGFAAPLLVLSGLAAGAAKLVSRVSTYLPRIERAIGALLVIVGIYLMVDAVGAPATGKVAVAEGYEPQKALIDPPLGQAAEKPRFVEFYSPDCSVCAGMVPIVNAIEKECGSKGVEILKVDVAEKSNRMLAAEHNVRGVPTFVYFDKDGREVARLIGYQTPQSLKQAMAIMLGDERCSGVTQLAPLEPPTCSD
ncbi:MAG: cytochrome c biogenesis protein CcdA, partial [Pseudomonadota bacterium]